MAPAIAVEAQWKPPDGEYFRQAAEARERPLFLHQKGRVDLVGRIIEGDDQIQSAIESRDPAMSGAVLVQHHSGQRLARPLAPVCSTPRRLLKVAAVLKISLGPAVAPAEAVGLHQVLVEVLGSKSLIALPVEPLDFLDLSGRNAPRNSLPSRRSNRPASPSSS